MKHNETSMRIVGRRKEPAITFSPSPALLATGIGFNDDLQRLPTGKLDFVPKGVYSFRTHEDANRFDRECVCKRMADIARERAQSCQN